jgi:nucleoside-diphosphate-sugar epimerase
VQLLEAGHEVRTTVRSLRREAEVRLLVKAGGVEAGERLRFVEADLEKDAGWAEAVKGCEYVLHMASPFPLKAPKNEDELIVPARDGALRVLRAARDAGVRRVVLTSSFAAIGYGHKPQEAAFDETTWTDLTGTRAVPAYPKSKTIAERAAWDFVAREGGGLELSVVNPVAVLGPVLGADFATSIVIVQKLMDGSMPGVPRLSFGVVDVRDVVELHLLAMTSPAAKGERFLAVAGESIAMLEIARVLKMRLGEAARKVPTRQIPDWVLRFAAIFDATVRGVLPELGNVKHASNAKAKRVLGWKPRSNEEAIVATAESLIALGMVK